jgi:hypothetical protein
MSTINGILQFPAELTARRQWCLWRIEPDNKGRPTKVPYRPDGRKAASDNSTTWHSYEAVHAALLRQPGVYGGVGYFFAADDPNCGVDLDVSLDGTGNLLPWASDIVARFENTYRACSVSGYGLHVLCRATLPGKGRNYNVPNGPIDPHGKRAQIGLSDQGRFFALTGQVFQDSPLTIADHQETIDWVLSRMEPRKHKPGDAELWNTSLSDAEIIEHAQGARTAPSFPIFGTATGRATTGRSRRPTSRCAACSLSGAGRTLHASLQFLARVGWPVRSGWNEATTGTEQFRPRLTARRTTMIRHEHSS